MGWMEEADARAGLFRLGDVAGRRDVDDSEDWSAAQSRRNRPTPFDGVEWTIRAEYDLISNARAPAVDPPFCLRRRLLLCELICSVAAATPCNDIS